MNQASSSVPIFTPDDDGFHAHLRGDDWWFTETAWFSFHHAERKLGGWLYTLARHKIGTVSGGAWVWDDTAHLPWEVPYSSNLTALRLPPDLDLRDATLPNGVRVQVETPMMAYRLGYDDSGRFSADLRFEAVLPPRPLTSGASTFGHSAHFDQIGRVTGTVELHGEAIDIDCWSMRDRTWGRRPEDRPRQAAYVTGAGDDGTGFLAVTNTRDGRDSVAYGFVQRGDAQVTLVDGERTVRRSPGGWISWIRIEAVDADGESLVATGTPVSRIVINRHSFIDINSLVRWEVEGAPTWWGEDQDMWPVHRFTAAKRSGDWSVPGTRR
ncbi:MAG: hypothetical protein OXH86_00810 [Acidimicrobiaceae bacterium]|nr:hypothetical protein [Acidimicrobiaceae bacterium]